MIINRNSIMGAALALSFLAADKGGASGGSGKNLTAKMTRDIDIDNATEADLLAWYNENSGSSRQLASFKDLETARKRCTELKAAITDLAGTGGTKGKKAAGAKGGKKATGAKGAKGGAKKEKAESTGTKGRASEYAGKKLYPVYKDPETKKLVNPRRMPTTAGKSYEIILKKPGISYEDFRAAGGRGQDLRYDVAHEFVEARNK